MAFDDPVVWVLMISIAIFLFGSSKIPALARSLGEARKEFDLASKGLLGTTTQNGDGTSLSKKMQQPPQHAIEPTDSDPLVAAAHKEGGGDRRKTERTDS